MYELSNLSYNFGTNIPLALLEVTKSTWEEESMPRTDDGTNAGSTKARRFMGVCMVNSSEAGTG